MKAEDSSMNSHVLRMMLAPGDGEIKPFDGYVEILFSDYDHDNGKIKYHDPARIRVNVSFVNRNGLDAETVKMWAEVLDTAYMLVTDTISPTIPKNVLEVWGGIKRSFINTAN